jgi:hypothetical protein
MPLESPLLVPLQVCPRAPGNAAQYVDQITGNVLWGVGVLFVVAIVVGIGAIVAGRLFNMPHSGYALTPTTAQQVAAIPGSPTAPVQGQAYRDQVAAAPILTVPANAASTPEIATVVGPAMTVLVATTVWNSERWNGPLVARPSEFLEVVRGSWRYGLGSVRGPLTTAAPTWTKTPDQILNRINRKRSNTTSH